jgi:hypothetical protein
MVSKITCMEIKLTDHKVTGRLEQQNEFHKIFNNHVIIKIQVVI